MPADGSTSPKTSARARAPGVLLWYRLYCGFNLLLEGATGLAGLALCLFSQPMAEFYRDHPEARATVPLVDPSVPGMYLVAGLLCAGEGLVMGSIFLATFFLPRKPWAWVCHLIVLAFGLTGCDIVFCLPLMIFWLRADNRTYFGCDKWLK
jgi:hypothetical protein